RPARGVASVVARGAGHRNRRHPARGREQRSGAPAGGPRRPAAGGRGLPRGGPVAGPLPPVPAADGAGTGLLAARHAAVRPLAARRLGDAERLSLHRQAVRARRRAGGRSPAQVTRRAGARGRAQSAAAQPGRRHGDRPPHGAVRRRLGARGAARRRAGRAGLRPRVRSPVPGYAAVRGVAERPYDRHRPGVGARPPTRLTGTVRLDGRSDTLGVYADLTADSLSFDGLKGSFPALPLRGAVAGRVQLTGPLAALETHADLRSAGGAVQGDGVLLLGGKGARTGARDFTLHARDLDLARWLDRGPASLLTFSVEGSVVADGALPPVGALRARVAPSLFAGTPLDSGVAVVRFAERHLYVDSLRLAQPGLITTGSGALGWGHGDRGTLALDFNADSLNSLDSLLSWVTAGGSDRTAD